jgi:uncharacterized protein (DUF111 family)
MTAEAAGYVLNKLMEGDSAGHKALDAWLTPIHMKKDRPAFTLSVLTRPGAPADALAMVVLRETTSIGVRRYGVQRVALPREELVVDVDVTNAVAANGDVAAAGAAGGGVDSRHKEAKVAHGSCRVKVAYLPEGGCGGGSDGGGSGGRRQVMNAKPEYDDCVELAHRSGLPLKQVLLRAQSAVQDALGRDPRFL